MSYKQHFSRFLAADPERLHFAAHSHHYWPDVSFDAQQQAWVDAARHADRKWEHVFGAVLPEVRTAIARVLALPDPDSIAFAPNTHELLMRILSCIEADRVRVLATGSEFLSFARQSRRLEEAGRMQVTRIPTEPFATFADRFLDAAAAGGHDLVYVSQVFFDSGFVFERFAELARAVPGEGCFVVVDGYHGFLALPTDLSAIADRVFYLAGGYKYAMSGEGACFLHCPRDLGPRPLDTGWFAGFGSLEGGLGTGRVPYATGGARFQGSTIDPTPLYRMRAVLRLLDAVGLDVGRIHGHVHGLQQRFLAALGERALSRLPPDALLPPPEVGVRGHFLTFRTPEAPALHAALARQGVVTDYRGDRLRIGFGLYHDAEDVDQLVVRLAAALATG